MFISYRFGLILEQLKSFGIIPKMDDFDWVMPDSVRSVLGCKSTMKPTSVVSNVKILKTARCTNEEPVYSGIALPSALSLLTNVLPAPRW